MKTDRELLEMAAEITGIEKLNNDTRKLSIVMMSDQHTPEPRASLEQLSQNGSLKVLARNIELEKQSVELAFAQMPVPNLPGKYTTDYIKKRKLL